VDRDAPHARALLPHRSDLQSLHSDLRVDQPSARKPRYEPPTRSKGSDRRSADEKPGSHHDLRHIRLRANFLSNEKAGLVKRKSSAILPLSQPEGKPLISSRFSLTSSRGRAWSSPSAGQFVGWLLTDKREAPNHSTSPANARTCVGSAERARNFPCPREGLCARGGLVELVRWGPKARRGCLPSLEPDRAGSRHRCRSVPLPVAARTAGDVSVRYFLRPGSFPNRASEVRVFPGAPGIELEVAS